MGENLDETNVDEAIDKAIEKYFQKGLLIDGLFWSKCMAIYRDRVKKVKRKRMVRSED